jgi:Cu/Ag efflux protein CusF
MRNLFFVIFMALFFAGCAEDHSGHGGHSPSMRSQGEIITYRVSGVVEKINFDAQTATIKHGDIKGVMPGMTMDFPMRDAATLALLKPGDNIEFWLETGGESPVIVELKKLP